MAVKIVDNTAILRVKERNNTSVMIRMMLRDIHNRSTKVTPMKTGNLRAQVQERVDGSRGYIQWSANYAIYQEAGAKGGKKWHYTTEGTGAHFAENAVRDVVGDLDVYARKANII